MAAGILGRGVTPVTDYRTLSTLTELDYTFGTGLTEAANIVTTDDSKIVHDNLSGYVANEHIDHSGVSVTLTGTSNEVEVTGAAQTIDSNVAFTLGLPTNVTIGGTLTATTAVATDDITERTSASGVTIDSVLLKDGGITLGTGSAVDTIETAITNDNTHIPTSGAVYAYSPTISGSPANNYLAVWTDVRTLEGASGLQYDGTDLTLTTGDFTITGDILPNTNSARDLGATGTRWQYIFGDNIYTTTNLYIGSDYVNAISDNVGTGDSNTIATTQAVYDYVDADQKTTVVASNVEFNSTTVTSDASETTILSDTSITNVVYENGDLYHLTLTGSYGAAGGASLDIALKLDTTEFANFTLPSVTGQNSFKADIYFGATSGTLSTAFCSATLDDTSSTSVHVIRATPANHGTGDGLVVTGTLSTATSSSFYIYTQHLVKYKA